MSNEVIMIVTALADLAVVLLCYRLGRQYLVTILAINLVLVSLTAAKTGQVFGVVASPQSIFYASIFLGTDIITEKYGRRAGHQAVLVGFVSLLLLIGLGQAVVLFDPVESAKGLSESINSVFGVAARVAVGSFTAYLVAQNLDIWLFHKIREATKGHYLWLRNNGSTLVSQALDTAIFFPIAFYGTMPNEELLSLMIFAYVVKLLVAAIDTPFMYLASIFEPSDARGRA